MQKALTDKTIEALKPGPKRYDVNDLRCPGLQLRVSPSGRKVFWDAFVDDAYAGVNAGKLDPDFLDIVDCLREWDEGGVWALAFAR